MPHCARFLMIFRSTHKINTIFTLIFAATIPRRAVVLLRRGWRRIFGNRFRAVFDGLRHIAEVRHGLLLIDVGFQSPGKPEHHADALVVGFGALVTDHAPHRPGDLLHDFGEALLTSPIPLPLSRRLQGELVRQIAFHDFVGRYALAGLGPSHHLLHQGPYRLDQGIVKGLGGRKVSVAWKDLLGAQLGCQVGGRTPHGADFLDGKGLDEALDTVVPLGRTQQPYD